MPIETAPPTFSPTKTPTELFYNTTSGQGENRLCGGVLGPYLEWHSAHEGDATAGGSLDTMAYRGLYVDVNTARCQFPCKIVRTDKVDSTPVYVVSLTGVEGDWEMIRRPRASNRKGAHGRPARTLNPCEGPKTCHR